MQLADDLFLGTRGCVVRIQKRDGQEVWRTKLKGRDLVVVAVEPDGIFAYTRGRLWSLEPDTGAIRWVNELPGLGYGYAIIASANQGPGHRGGDPGGGDFGPDGCSGFDDIVMARHQ